MDRPTPHREIALQRLFSTFPGGWPGAGLLLLRTLAGVAALVQGSGYLSNSGHLAAGGLAVGLLFTATGACLLIGLFTPAVSILAGLGALGIALEWFPPAAWTLFDSNLAIAEMIAVSVAIAFLGPGAYSLDCRMFGRREIVIPPAPNKHTR